MKKKTILALGGFIATTLLSGGAQAATAAGTCDRACLESLADKLVDSIVQHRPGDAPLDESYRATENNVTAAPGMMAIWQTATRAENKFYVTDPATGQLFMAMTMYEGDYPSLFFGRIKANNAKLSELELFVTRSRGEAGFQYDASQMANLPVEWTKAVGKKSLPTRAQLLEAGKAIFDPKVESPSPSASCMLLENGKIVEEDPEVLKAISPPDAPAPDKAFYNANGTVSIPCGLPPDRPSDAQARTDIVDVEKGVVVSMATIHGMVEPYLATKPTLSAFIPDAMLPPYMALLKAQQAKGGVGPAIQGGPATIFVSQIHRVYDGKVQGIHMLQKLAPPKAVSPWTE